jgi:threonine dehydrogenase-like Zn-dependent dehydrogenase
MGLLTIILHSLRGISYHCGGDHRPDDLETAKEEETNFNPESMEMDENGLTRS